MIVEASRSVICKAFWQAGNSGRSCCCSLEFKGGLEQNSGRIWTVKVTDEFSDGNELHVIGN